MNPLESLHSYLTALHRRLTLAAVARGAAIVAACALGATLALVLVMNGFAFSGTSVTASRIALAMALGAALALALVVPVLRLSRWRAAARAEREAPGLEQRLLTVAERGRPGDPFTELLAADALERAPEPASIVSRGSLFGFASGAALSCLGLVWLVAAGPGYLGYGASLLWGAPDRGNKPFYEVLVAPGDRTVRRNSDQLVTARLAGFVAPQARVFARYRGATKWEEASMQPRREDNGFEFLFAGIPESLEYYVLARNVRSRTYTFSVKDLPAVSGIRVTYRYPAWTGLKPEIEDPGGDLRAVEGTEAELAVKTDRPLDNGVLVLSDGARIPLENGRARVPIKKEDTYHVAAVDNGELVRLTDDYFIEAQPDMPPVVKIERPGRDARVSPIEEVTVEASADDDFGLRELTLHYSVNGGLEQTVPIQGKRGSATLYLEEFNLVPGDIVSMYATAKDARTSARTDMYFLQAEPFERRYSQAQAGGGEGEQGGENARISERQKEIIAATWNELRGTADRTRSSENARFLSDVQTKLRNQAESLARRMKSRELAVENEDFRTFTREMEAAAQAMSPASERLGAMRWRDALEPEQKALQHLLRAEAIFRDIQVAFGRQNGRGGQGGGAGRELESLFDLELDTEKNQYETGSRASQGGQREQEMDEAFQKLRELARRQQELAQQQRNQQQAFQQRWQQEMLRREAEELRRKMQEMARSGQQGSQAAQGAAGQLQRAIEEMRRANSQGQQGGSADAQRAAERLQQAQQALGQARRNESGSQLEDLSRRAGQMGAEQEQYVQKLQQQFGADAAQPAPSLTRRGPSAELAKEREKMLAELQKLEQDMNRAARGLQSTEPGAASRVREALGDLQGNEIRSRVRYNAELLRRGYGAFTVMREAPVTRALQQLRENLQQAQQALGRDAQPGRGNNPEAERALQAVEQLRREMARNGQQPGQQQGPQQGRNGQPGQEGEGGSSLENGGGAQRGIMRLQRALQNFPELARKIEGASARDLAGRLAQIELELRRKLGEDAATEARSHISEPVPPGYAEAVSEYFKRLSKKP